MRSSYLDHDVTILLKDITGLVEPQPAAEREKKNSVWGPLLRDVAFGIFAVGSLSNSL